MKELRTWKKLFENDLESVIIEMKETLKSPCVLILSGPVGVGKTTFTKYFVKNVTNIFKEIDIHSPSYSLVNENNNVVHADFYRIEDPEEIIHLELPLYLENKDYFLVEWGREYLRFLSREVPESFQFYELVFEMVSTEDEKNSQRNLTLFDITSEV